jgi:hypothetical protein
MGPKNAADKLDTDPRAAALVRYGKTPAAYAILPAFDNGFSDAAGPNNHDAAVGPPMRANASRMGIGREDGQVKSVLVFCKLHEHGRIARARQCEAGGNAMVPARNSSGFETLRHGLIGGRETFLQSEAHIRGTGFALAKNGAGKTAHARTAARAAAIHAKKKDLTNHLEAPIPMLI